MHALARSGWLLVGTLLVAPIVLGALATPALASHICDPYPFERCGNYQREARVFCYVAGKPKGIYISATETTNIVSVGSGSASASVQGVGSASSTELLAWLLAPVLPLLPVVPGDGDASVPESVNIGQLAQQPVPPPVGGAVARGYINVTPLLKFVADPFNAPLPTKSVYRETNYSPGLQLVSHRCDTFFWFAECEPAQWMDFSPSAVRAPDAKVA